MTRGIAPFRSILVPLDGSLFSEQALPFALAIGRAARSKVRLVLVHQTPTIPLSMEAARFSTSMQLATRRSERRYLRELASRFQETGGPRVVSALLTGTVAETLTHYVHDSRTDLVVMSTHGRGPLQRAWLGSVADQLIRTLKVPVLLIRPQEGETVAPGPPTIGRILVPLDGSPLAEAALEPTAGLAQLLGAEMVLLQVVPPLIVDIPPMGPRPIGYHENIALLRSEAEKYLQGLAERLVHKGLRATALAVVGNNVAGTILELARRERVDLLAVATHGRGGIIRLTLGSVADKVVRAAEIPVLVFRPTKMPRRRSS